MIENELPFTVTLHVGRRGGHEFTLTVGGQVHGQPAARGVDAARILQSGKPFIAKKWRAIIAVQLLPGARTNARDPFVSANFQVRYGRRRSHFPGELSLNCRRAPWPTRFFANGRRGIPRAAARAGESGSHVGRPRGTVRSLPETKPRGGWQKRDRSR